MDESKKYCNSASNQGERLTVQKINKQIRAEWTNLWNEKLEDKLSAEELANRDYHLLFIEKGTVLKATRSYRSPCLEEIIKMNENLLNIKLTGSFSEVVGWRQFSRNILSKQPDWHRTKK